MSNNKDERYFEQDMPFLTKNNSEVKYNDLNKKINPNFAQNNESWEKLNNHINMKQSNLEFIEPKISHLMSFEDTSNLFARNISNVDNKIINVNINYNTTINNFKNKEEKKFSKNEWNEQYNLIFTTFNKSNKKSQEAIIANSSMDLNNDSLTNLEQILLKLFLNEEIGYKEINNLNKYEKEILDMIIIRKFNKKTNNLEEDENKDFLDDLLKKFQNSLKRSEENHKFVLKRGIKNLFDKFKKNTLKKFKTKSQEEKEFYLSYFSSYINNNLKIENFYFPKK